jgi:hypothetical protein
MFMSQYCKILMATGLAAGLSSVASAAVTYDGTLNTSEYGSALATQASGPANTSGFGAGHEINAFYATTSGSTLSLGIAGNVQDGNRIVVFIDSKAGGFNTGNFGRTGAPAGVSTFNSGSTFDTGFNADYALVIGTNSAHDNFFYDLFTLAGTAAGGGGSNSYLGSPFDSTGDSLAAAPANSDNTKGFELGLDLTSQLGYTTGDIKFFALYTSDGGFLNNKFLTPAGSGDGNYGNGAVDFSAAAPNPMTLVVPEPASLGLVGLAGLAGLRRRPRTK